MGFWVEKYYNLCLENLAKKSSMSIRKLLDNEKKKYWQQKQNKTKWSCNQKYIKIMEKYVGIFFWCSSWSWSFELWFAHGKDKGSTILTKQNKTIVEEK